MDIYSIFKFLHHGNEIFHFKFKISKFKSIYCLYRIRDNCGKQCLLVPSRQSRSLREPQSPRSVRGRSGCAPEMQALEEGFADRISINQKTQLLPPPCFSAFSACFSSFRRFRIGSCVVLRCGALERTFTFLTAFRYSLYLDFLAISPSKK